MEACATGKTSLSMIRFFIMAAMGTCLIQGQESPSLAGQIERQQQQIEQQQAEQLRRIQEQADSSTQQAPIEDLSSKPQSLEEVFKDSPELYFKKLELTGNTKLGKDFLYALRVNYEKKYLKVENIRNILREITNEYVRLGYVTCRAYLPPQDFTSEILQVGLIEGKLEKYTLEKGKNKVNTANAMPGTVGEVVNIRDVEQGFEQINRLKSNNAKMDIRPGSNQGQSDILIKNSKGKRWHLDLSLNNYGLENTGEWQLFTTYSHDNLLGLNDLISVTHGFDPTLGDDGGYNQLNSALLSIPYGYWLFKAGINTSEYKNYQTNDGIEIRSEGETRGFSLDVDYLFHRDKTTKYYIHGGLQYKKSKNFINDVLLEVNSRETCALYLATSMIKTLDQGNSQLYAKASYRHGVPFFGAQGHPLFDGPDPRFHKFDLYTSYNTKLEVFEKKWGSITSLNLQFAADDLFANEQINLGGHTSIRGYRNESLTSDNGCYFRQEINLPIRGHKILKKEINLIQPYAAYDMGFLVGDLADEQEGLIHGATLGTRFTYKNTSAEVSLSVPFSSPDFITENDPILGVSLSQSF